MSSAGTARGKAQAYVAFLRGINVAGKNMLPMSALVALFSDAGCTDVRTYIQSGNVLFTAPARVLSRLAEEIAERIQQTTKLRVPVVLRSQAELDQAARANPFIARGVDANVLHVMFLSTAPDAAAIARLDPRRSPSDEFIVAGREIYLHCPNGFGRTKLTNEYFDSKLAVVSTCRNWRTVGKLLELLEGS